jgi:hypothetical protein
VLGGAVVEDVISQGDERPPRDGRRRLLVGAALVAVAVLVVVQHLPHDRPGGTRVANGRGPGGRPVPVQLPADPAALPPSGIIGRTAAWAPDVRLPRSGARPDWFWPAMGRIAPILGLPSGRPGYVFTRLVGGWAIQPDPARPAACGNCAALGPVYYLADRARRAVLVSRARLVAPAAADGHMWLTSYAPGSDLGRTPGVAQQYTGSGARIGAPVTLPAGYGITQGTTRGLLLVSLSLGGQGNADRLWNPATGKVLRRFDGVVAVNATAVAYAPPCARTCPVDVFNVTSGRRFTVKMRPTDSVTAGVFSPDGRFLALQISRGNGEVSDGGASAAQLEVASAASGHATVVPRIFVSSDALAAFGWPGSRDDLIAEFRSGSKTQLAFWDPAAAGNIAVADIKPAQDPAALVVG